MLSDGDRKVALAYGAAQDTQQQKPARVSVLVGAHGRVLRAYDAPDPGTHAEQVLTDLKAALR